MVNFMDGIPWLSLRKVLNAQIMRQGLTNVLYWSQQRNKKIEDRRKPEIIVTKTMLIKITEEKSNKKKLLISFLMRMLLHIVGPVLLINFCGNFW